MVHEAVDEGILGLHLHPKDIGGAVVSVDQTDEPSEWTWAGPNWRNHQNATQVSALAAVEIQSDDPVATAERWGAILDRPITVDGPGAVVHLDDALVRFVAVTDGRGEGVSGFDVVATDRARAGTGCIVVGSRVEFV